MKIKYICINLALVGLGFSTLMAQELNDDPAKEWCYLKKSTTVLGMPYNSQVTEVTYDGALYTGHIELNFAAGSKENPLLLRQKTFLEGWIPVVGDVWKEDGLDYSIQMFAAPATQEGIFNCLNFVRISVVNHTTSVREVRLVASLRGKLDDSRFVDLQGFASTNKYEIKESAVYRDGELLCWFDPSYMKVEAVEGKPYVRPYSVASVQLTPATRTALMHYRRKLQPGQSVDYFFKLPAVPVRDNQVVNQILAADYTVHLASTIAFWKQQVVGNTHFEIPEERIEDAQRASMVHLLLATRTAADGSVLQTDGLPYPRFFLTSGPHMALAYMTNGCKEYARMILKNAIQFQEPNGMYLDKSLSFGTKIPTAHGHILYLASMYYLFTQDRALLAELFPSIVKAIDYLRREISANPYGLLPPAHPYDNEMIEGHYTSTNLWAILGIRCSIRLAQELGCTDVVVDWKALETQYAANLLKAIEASVQPDGYVPTGLYDFKTGKQTSFGLDEYRTNCDWENMLLAYPTELFQPKHTYVQSTLKHIRKNYAEGIMTYRHGEFLHQYITANLIEQYMVAGNSRQALIDFYHLILHAGSTHEGFENMIFPWKDRLVDPRCPSPHAWAAAKTAFLIRNFMLHEYGGNIENASERDLYIYPVVSPAWATAGEYLAIVNAPSEFGRITSRLDFTEQGATLTYSPLYNAAQPRSVRFRIPYFKELQSFKTDASESHMEDDCIVLSPDFTSLHIQWKEKKQVHKGTFAELLKAYRSCDSFGGSDEKGYPRMIPGKAFLLEDEDVSLVEPLNFGLVKKAFLKEFNRRTSNQNGK